MDWWKNKYSSCSLQFLTINFTLVQNRADYAPNLAIDGHLHDINQGSGFFHPDSDSPNEWFQIDMGREETVCKLRLYFRRDGSSLDKPERRSNIEVRVGNVPATNDHTGNPVCSTLTTLRSAFETDLRCSSPLTGLFIVIRKTSNKFWDLDEVSAYRFSDQLSEISCDTLCTGKY